MSIPIFDYDISFVSPLIAHMRSGELSFFLLGEKNDILC